MKELLEKLNASRLAAYRACPRDILEHAGKEESVSAGGYGYRQILELVQNGADAILEAQQAGSSNTGARIEVRLSGKYLYVANTGAPLSEKGLEALLSSDISPKRGNEIGRFGLGFKSLLRLGGTIDIFTLKAGAIRFDPEKCRQVLRKEFAVAAVPGLRLAWPLDAVARAADPELESLRWAETIVRAEVLAPGLRGHLETEIREFPREFLLFLDHPVELCLCPGKERPLVLRVEDKGGVKILHAPDEQVRWRVFRRDVAVTDHEAVVDATSIHARKSVPLAWATPMDAKREEAGRFWAFFPTHTPTYLPGILNAPWKLNSDRNSLVRGEWNDSLMREAAMLVLDNLPALSASEDPGRPLDAFPRQPDRQDDDAVPLINAIWAALPDAPVIPNGTGTLRTARTLRRHPQDSQELVEEWQGLAASDRLACMVHSSCLERLRISRMGALAERLRIAHAAKGEAAPFERCKNREWFDAVASTNVGRALQALKLAERYRLSCTHIEWLQALPDAAIIPTEEGQLLTSGRVVLIPPGTHVPPGRHAVAAALWANTEAQKILVETFGIRPLDNTKWESILNESLPSEYTWVSQDWPGFWANLRAAPREIALKFIVSHKTRIRAQRRDGYWGFAHEILLAGEIVRSDDESTNARLLVHRETHKADQDLITAIGITACPEGNVRTREFPGLHDWRSHWRTHYYQHHHSSPRADYLNPQGLVMPSMAWFLHALTGAANARLTAKLLPLLAECPKTCRFGHDTSDKYPVIDVSNPLPWLLLRYGKVAFGDSAVSLAACVQRFPTLFAALSFTPELLSSLLPSALSRLQAADQPACVATDEEIQDLWIACIEAAATPGRLNDDSLSSLWSAAAKDQVLPDTLATTFGEVSLSEIFVTSSPDLARRGRTAKRVVVTLDEQAIQLWQENGARPLAELMKPEWDTVTSPDLLLVDAIPELSQVLLEEARLNARCQPVESLHLVVGDSRDPLVCLVWEDRLLIDLAQFRGQSQQRRLTALLNELAPTAWLAFPVAEALRRIADATVQEKRAGVSAEPDLPARLLAAVEGQAEPLRAALGIMATHRLLADCAPRQLAELVLAQYGPATLSALRGALEESGLQPPSRWNTAEARTFVTSLGFPEIFADATAGRREPEEIITGPIALPPLHDFQDEVLHGIRSLLSSGTGRRRAVVSLPTGGGKTRVTVEAAVLLVLAPAGRKRSVIWIAQSDELCEQAVQAFRQVWLNRGAERTDLRIVRLWGGNPNPATQDPAKPLVVVASIQTLNARMGGASLDWLQQPGLVVVDECHHAITPSYTDLLRWLDAETQRPGAPARDEPPILGLSATPFRMDDDESRRLAARFSNRWFPADQANLYRRLLEQGVLAAVYNEAIESGVGLTEEEHRLFNVHGDHLEGIDFERLLEALNQRLAGVEERNQRIVDRVLGAEQRSILLFANSVNHANELSTRLNLRGIPSAAISGETPRIARRYFLDRFQRGELRVLCNHSVLSTGFDAPRTDMILIARQVFSPVRYMQIVGRGLRGVKNGGTSRCRIVTVLDNLGRFQNRHPYHYCASYFRTMDEVRVGSVAT